MAFTNPDLDPRGAGYNTEQARIAVGNGGLFGQGLFHGSQTRSGFVPEQHTDFIFTVAGEELGLVGAGLLIALLGVVIWRALAIAAAHRRHLRPGRRGRASPAGSASRPSRTSACAWASCRSPACPLPFVSYGGSSMFAGMLAIGLLQNIHLRSTAAADPVPRSPRAVAGRIAGSPARHLSARRDAARVGQSVEAGTT